MGGRGAEECPDAGIGAHRPGEAGERGAPRVDLRRDVVRSFI